MFEVGKTWTFIAAAVPTTRERPLHPDGSPAKGQTSDPPPFQGMAKAAGHAIL